MARCIRTAEPVNRLPHEPLRSPRGEKDACRGGALPQERGGPEGRLRGWQAPGRYPPQEREGAGLFANPKVRPPQL